MPNVLQSILVSTDGSETATLAVRAASEISSGTGARLHLVHVWQGAPPVRTIADEPVREPEQEAIELLRRQEWQAKTAGATVIEKHLRAGRPAEEIAALSEEVGADLIVVGSRKMGTLGRLVLGSVSREVVRGASRPVLIVGGGWPPSRVLVGDDLSEEAGLAGELAAIIGGLYKAPVRLTTAYPPDNRYLSYAANRRRTGETERSIGQALRARAAVIGHALEETPHTEVAPRDPGHVLQGTEGTLVAVGRRGLGALKRAVLGGVSDDVLRTAGGPVLIAPAKRGSRGAGPTRALPQHGSHPGRASSPSGTGRTG